MYVYIAKWSVPSLSLMRLNCLVEHLRVKSQLSRDVLGLKMLNAKTRCRSLAVIEIIYHVLHFTLSLSGQDLVLSYTPSGKK